MSSPTVPTLPQAPVPSDPPATFDALAGAFVPALNPFGVAVNAVGQYVETTAAEVAENAGVASAAAGFANYQGDWLVGTTYTTGQSVRDDGRFWFALAGSTGVTPTEGATWTEIIRIPTPVEDGQVLAGSGAGLAYVAAGRSAQPGEYLVEVRYLATETFTVPPTVTSLRVYAVGKGGNATTGASGSGGGMAFGTITVTPGEELEIDITSGVAKLSRGVTDLFTANGAADSVSSTPGTAGTASIDGAVTDGAAYTGGTGFADASAGGASAGSPLGAGVSAAANNTAGCGIGGAGGAGGGGGVGGAGATASGGAGGAASGLNPGIGRARLAFFADPLLRHCIASGSRNGATNVANQAGPGAGGGDGSSARSDGGFGGGGGRTASTKSGNGGELAGGAGGGASGGGDGGIGGGGGSSSGTPGLGGPAAVWLFY